MKKMAQNSTPEKNITQEEGGRTERKGRNERPKCVPPTLLPPQSLWYDKFMHSSCVCQSRKARGVVGQFLWQEGGKRGRKEEKEKKMGGGERERERELRH